MEPGLRRRAAAVTTSDEAVRSRRSRGRRRRGLPGGDAPARQPGATVRLLEVPDLHRERELVGVLDRGLRLDAQVLSRELEVLAEDVIVRADAPARHVVLLQVVGDELLLLPLAERLELGGRDVVRQLDQVVVLARQRADEGEAATAACRLWRGGGGAAPARPLPA